MTNFALNNLSVINAFSGNPFQNYICITIGNYWIIYGRAILSEMMTTTSRQARTFVLFAEWAGPVSAVLIVEPEVYIVHLKQTFTYKGPFLTLLLSYQPRVTVM